MKGLIAISVVLFALVTFSARKEKENKVDKNLHPGSSLIKNNADKDSIDDDDSGADG